jgi:excisionase family DNA binding protein
MAERKLYPIEETAGVLGVGRTTVYSLVDKGELHLVHIGRRGLVTAESIDAYVERLSGVPAAEAS